VTPPTVYAFVLTDGEDDRLALRAFLEGGRVQPQSHDRATLEGCADPRPVIRERIESCS